MPGQASDGSASLRVVTQHSCTTFPFKPVSHAPNGDDKPRRGRIFLDLFPETANVNRQRMAIAVRAPESLVEILPREDLARVFGEKLEQLEFARSEFDRCSIDRDLMRTRIDHKPTIVDRWRHSRFTPLDPAQHRLDARNDFGGGC